ncbi:hypothetical protein OK016_28905 [Vibrio chagasii]|nr:hypothetical protein [Vibrio chagasii]
MAVEQINSMCGGDGSNVEQTGEVESFNSQRCLDLLNEVEQRSHHRDCKLMEHQVVASQVTQNISLIV